MPTVVIVGAQWGDEGKGKIVDFCTEYADVVVRYAGGPNAGHTLVVGDDKLIVRLIPSGILRPQTRCVLAHGMVIDPAVLVSEMDELDRRGLQPDSRLCVSDRAHVILPYHVLIDTMRDGQNVLLEGAQGTLLDIDFGTYPYVTSSSASAAGAAAGTGIGPTRVDSVIGITKAYATRVGGGPFPTELLDATGDKLREDGVEFGSVTGRPRRTGWIDLPALRYAARVNGLDGLAVTKLDVLTGHPTLKVCVAYDTPRGRTVEFPIDMLDEPTTIRPVYETLDGWTESLAEVRSKDDLPRAAREYLR